MPDPEEQHGFELGGGAGGQGGEGYVVLARKYRPETFEDLIGQDAMVTTLRSAFATDRIAQGYMLTGVRGVGKTTTARILARALNYDRGHAEAGKPTVDLSAGYGSHCRAILKSTHPDVLEMDAASNTGVDNIREIIESARYKPMSARYKVFIIDEVHMLSKGAFNALLKTLEEPPGHVKFIFATTEVRKVPVTILSRCQRFDLRRVDVGLLMRHFSRICELEGATADEDALAIIARAAEGSVRDGLSLLDQAIAMGAGKVTATQVRAMLGLADRGRVFDLLEACLAGTPKSALEQFEALHADGGDPIQLLTDLADAVHAVTRAKTLGASAAGDGLSNDERARAGAFADRLSIAILTRTWQLLTKGLEEAARAPDGRAAAEMILIRLAYTADLPTPDELTRALSGKTNAEHGGNSTGPAKRSGPGATARINRPAVAAVPAEDPTARVAAETAARPASRATAALALENFDGVIALAGEKRDAILKLHLEDHVRLVRFAPGRIEINVLDGAPTDLAGDLGRKLTDWTGERWIVTVTAEQGAEPVGVVKRRNLARDMEEVREHPAVAALLSGLPNATIAAVRPIGGVSNAGPGYRSSETPADDPDSEVDADFDSVDGGD